MGRNRLASDVLGRVDGDRLSTNGDRRQMDARKGVREIALLLLVLVVLSCSYLGRKPVLVLRT